MDYYHSIAVQYRKVMFLIFPYFILSSSLPGFQRVCAILVAEYTVCNYHTA